MADQRRRNHDAKLAVLLQRHLPSQALKWLKIACAASDKATCAVLADAQRLRKTRRAEREAGRKMVDDVLDWFCRDLTEAARLDIARDLRLDPVCGGCRTCSMCSASAAGDVVDEVGKAAESAPVLALRSALKVRPELWMDIAECQLKGWRTNVTGGLYTLLLDRIDIGDYLKAQVHRRAAIDQGVASFAQPQQALLRVVNTSQRHPATGSRLVAAQLVCFRTLTPVLGVPRWSEADGMSSLVVALRELGEVPRAGTRVVDADTGEARTQSAHDEMRANSACFVFVFHHRVDSSQLLPFGGDPSVYEWQLPARVESTEPRLFDSAWSERIVGTSERRAARDALASHTPLPAELGRLCVDYVDLSLARMAREAETGSASWRETELRLPKLGGGQERVKVLSNRSLWRKKNRALANLDNPKSRVQKIFPRPRDWAAARRLLDTPLQEALQQAVAAWDDKNDLA